ncbi:MAG: PAS domain-containing protein [Roseofilum sp. SID1]|uniref:PAS domain-containing hybrid sensor histidine kinase/response regulator n=1 Tax=Roseofilum sp. SID1 TaxID=2821497 RepID=UPI001B0F9C21|nr:ATP-binding protein [Roseofilum sp. SID1]MBP0038009.1 PAS domain-containing protein [Roseofilum sp. SID1]
MRDDLTDRTHSRDTQRAEISSGDRLALITHTSSQGEIIQNQLVELGYDIQLFPNWEDRMPPDFLPNLVLIQSHSASYWQQVYQSLKSDPKTHGIPLLVLTNDSVDLATVKRLVLQGVRFISSSQPIDLVSAIEGQLHQSQLRDQLREKSAYLLPCPDCYLWQQPISPSTSSEYLLSGNASLLEVQRIAHFGSWEWERQEEIRLSQEIRGSQETYRILGIDPQRLTYAQVLKKLPAQDRREFHQRIQEAIATGKAQEWELALYSGDGQLRYCELRVQPILGIDSKVRGLFGILLDISDRRLLEQKIQTSEMEMRSVFGAMGDIVLVLDRAGETIKMSPTAPALGEGVELISETINQIIYGEQRETLCQQLQQVVTDRITLTLDYALDLEDSKVWFSATLSPMLEDQVILIARDITERKNVELERDLALEQAESASHAKSRFLANMSHELRTPLNAILGFTQVLLRDACFSDEHENYLNIIYHSGEHLLGLINNILDLSKVEAGYIEINPTSINIQVFLESLYQMLNLKAAEKQLHFEVQKITRLPECLETDQGKLRQILINLLGNAIKFTTRGQVILRVGYIEQREKQHLLAFEVEDTGPGIPPEEIELLFQPFQQTSTGLASQQGTGLGLSISHKFVELLGGKLTVSSVVDRGSIFKFQIPVEPECLLERQGHQEHPRVKGLAPDQPSYRILVIDDYSEDRQWLVTLLEMVGFVVEGAANGKEAIAQWHRFDPDLILMDLRMSYQNRYPTMEQIRAITQEKSIPIIAIAAMVFEDEDQLNAQIRYDRVLYKPLEESILLATIAEFLSLEYTYEDPLRISIFSEPIHTETVDVSIFLTMPELWLEDIYHATITLDDQRILELIEDLPGDRAELIQFIEQKLNGFDFESLLDLITPLLPESLLQHQALEE